MPAPLAVDREAVKAHAITHGVREAARAFGLSEDAVRQWSARGKWLADAGKAVVAQPLPKSMQPVVTNVTKPSEAALRQKLSDSQKARKFAGKAVLKGFRKAASWSGEAIIERADKLASLAKTGSIAYGDWGSEAAPFSVSLTVTPAESQVVDIEATVTRPEQ